MFFSILFYISIFFIVGGIWMIVDTFLAKDISQGIGGFLGAVTIVIGLLFFLFSDAPKFRSSNEVFISVDIEAPPKRNEN